VSAKLRVLMLLENNSYFEDSRVRNEAEALAAAGHRVTVLCPADREHPRVWRSGGITVRGLPFLAEIAERWGHVGEYTYFLIAATLAVLAASFRGGFDVIHAHNPPDVSFLIALPWKLLGRRFVFDHHDLSPEIFTIRFAGKWRFVFRILAAAERLSCRTADLIISTNESIRRVEIERAGADAGKIRIVRNGPRLDVFTPGAAERGERARPAFLLVYVGTIGPMDGVEYLLRALEILAREHGRDDVSCRVIGSGDSLEKCRRLAQELGVADRVEFTGWLQDEDSLVAAIRDADVCVDPAPANPLNDRLTMIKIMEYMALAKPIVAFDLPETRWSAAGAALYARPNECTDLARQIARLLADADLRAKMGEEGRARVASELAWEYSARELLAAYDSLVRD
jgi:glycosyltransferase involved in cell wall biosynthesis